MWDGMGMHGGWWLGMVLFWVLIIVAIVALVRWLSGKTSGANLPEKTPIQILQERYARGEIDREEYQRKKADLER